MPKSKLPPGIYIQLEGGLVQAVYYSGPRSTPLDKLSLFVIDFDDEGADPDEITTAIDKDGQEITAIVLEEGFYRLPPGCDIERLVLAEIAKRDAEP